MMMELRYQVMSFGPWTTVTISRDIALYLAIEYTELGWPVELNGRPYINNLAA